MVDSFATYCVIKELSVCNLDPRIQHQLDNFERPNFNGCGGDIYLTSSVRISAVWQGTT